MTAEEVAAVGWAGEEGWVTKDFGTNVEALGCPNSFTWKIGYGLSVASTTFDVQSTEAGKLVLNAMMQNGTSPPPSGLDGLWSSSTCQYKSSPGWSASRLTATPVSPETNPTMTQFSGIRTNGGHLLYLGTKTPKLDLGLDYIWVVQKACSSIGSPDASGEYPACPEADPTPIPATGRTPFDVALIGEMEWCQAHSADWAALMVQYFGKIALVFAPTKAHPTLVWKSCSIGYGAVNYQHNGQGAWIHRHLVNPDGPKHPWVFNSIPENHGTTMGDSSYFYAKITLNGQPNMVFNPQTGMNAYIKHDRMHYVQLEFPNNIQLYHKAPVSGAAGWGFEPGSLSLTTDATGDGLTPVHELGHNKWANHCDVAFHDGKYTVMASWSNTDPSECRSSWSNGRHAEFSQANTDNIDNHA